MLKLSKRNFINRPDEFLKELKRRLLEFTFTVDSIKDIDFLPPDKYGRNILRIKPTCLIHDKRKAARYIRFKSIIENNTKYPRFCKDCFSICQSKNGLVKPNEIQNRLRDSKDPIIKKYYTLVQANFEISNQGTQVCILRCGYHNGIEFSQSIEYIGKTRSCPNCIADRKKGKFKKDETHIKNIYKKLGSNAKYFKVNALQRRKYIYKNKEYHKIWVNLTCTNDNHEQPHIFWYYKERINPRVCKICRKNYSSIGEITVHKILRKLKFFPKRNYILKNCIYKNPLRVDFLLNINKQKLIIEFDGEQHFKPSKKWGGKRKWMNVVKRDIIKNNYVVTEFEKYKNIHLLRIHYKQLNDIEKLEIILEKTIDHLKSENPNPIKLNPNTEIREEYYKTYAKFQKESQLGVIE